MEALRNADNVVCKVAGDLILLRRLGRTLLMVVFAHESILWQRNECGFVNDFDVFEERRCRRSIGKRFDEQIEAALVESGYHQPYHMMPVCLAVMEDVCHYVIGWLPTEPVNCDDK